MCIGTTLANCWMSPFLMSNSCFLFKVCRVLYERSKTYISFPDELLVFVCHFHVSEYGLVWIYRRRKICFLQRIVKNVRLFTLHNGIFEYACAVRRILSGAKVRSNERGLLPKQLLSSSVHHLLSWFTWATNCETNEADPGTCDITLLRVYSFRELGRDLDWNFE